MSFTTFSQDDVGRARNRFGGYNLPKLTLDETGPSYIQLPPHPGNFDGVPSWWGQKAIAIESLGVWDSDMCWFERAPGSVVWRSSVDYYRDPTATPELIPIMSS